MGGVIFLGENMATENGSNTEERMQARVHDLILNALGSRSELLKQFFDPRRNLNHECGYPDKVEPAEYQNLYERNGIAARVVQVFPKETWQVMPEVYEDEDPTVLTPFEEDWKETGEYLQQINDYKSSPSQTVAAEFPGSETIDYEGDCTVYLWEALKRIDVVSGIGRYGVLFMGLDDGLALDHPARFREGQKITYLRTFPETQAPFSKVDENVSSPRFGQPTEYTITLNDPRAGTSWTAAATTTKRVHWSRVIHVADNLLSSEVFGTPRMQEVLNRLLDLDKLYGGSAEMYWRGAFPGLSFETHPTLGADPDLGSPDEKLLTKRMIENYMNGLQRYLALVGMSAKSLAPQVVDPTPQIMVQIQAICIRLGIPMRIFMGSERGELASSQDDAAWNDRLKERQKYHVNPRIIYAFVRRLIQLGVLRKPKKWNIFWPDLTSQSAGEKSQVAFQRTQALVQYVKGEGWRIVPPVLFLTKLLGFEEAEAIAVIQKAKDEKLFDLTSVQTSGRQDDYTNLGAGTGAKITG